jgi:hypothetical protein
MTIEGLSELVAVAGAAVAIWVSLATRKKLSVEADTELSQTALSLVAPLKIRITELECAVSTATKTIDQHSVTVKTLTIRVGHLERENTVLKSGVTILQEQVKSLGGSPMFTAPAPETL